MMEKYRVINTKYHNFKLGEIVTKVDDRTNSYKNDKILQIVNPEQLELMVDGSEFEVGEKYKVTGNGNKEYGIIHMFDIGTWVEIIQKGEFECRVKRENGTRQIIEYIHLDAKGDDGVNLIVGHRYKVIENESDHDFNIGQIVILDRIERDGLHLFTDINGEESWFMSVDEIEEYHTSDFSDDLEGFDPIELSDEVSESISQLGLMMEEFIEVGFTREEAMVLLLKLIPSCEK